MNKFYKEELTIISDDPDQEADIIEMINKHKEATPVTESVRIRLNRR
jgi:hypothetical protein